MCPPWFFHRVVAAAQAEERKCTPVFWQFFAKILWTPPAREHAHLLEGPTRNFIWEEGTRENPTLPFPQLAGERLRPPQLLKTYKTKE